MNIKFLNYIEFYNHISLIKPNSDTSYEFTVVNGRFQGLKFLYSFDVSKVSYAYVYYPFFNMDDAFKCEIQNMIFEFIEQIDLSVLKMPELIVFNGNSIFIEKLGTMRHLIVCGAGHVSISLIRLAKMLDFYVSVIDDRQEFCNNALLSGADNVICNNFSDALDNINVAADAFYVIVTRGHQYDLECLRSILKRQYSYIGLMGSKGRVAGIRERLILEGYDESRLNHIHMPIGLRIGAQTPSEIAVSIAAELIDILRHGQNVYCYSLETLNLIASTEKCAICVIVSKSGSGPREPGTKMLVTSKNHIAGTIGGGYAEACIIKEAMHCIDNNYCKLLTVNMTGEEAAEDGLVCGGSMQVFIQPLL